jgi:hypothetical protein
MLAFLLLLFVQLTSQELAVSQAVQELLVSQGTVHNASPSKTSEFDEFMVTVRLFPKSTAPLTPLLVDSLLFSNFFSLSFGFIFTQMLGI